MNEPRIALKCGDIICPNCGTGFAIVVDSGPTTAPEEYRRFFGSATTQPPAGTRRASPPADASDLAALLDAINPDSLEGKSLEFYSQTKERFEKYGATTRVSEKQLAWLQKLAAPESAETW